MRPSTGGQRHQSQSQRHQSTRTAGDPLGPSQYKPQVVHKPHNHSCPKVGSRCGIRGIVDTIISITILSKPTGSCPSQYVEHDRRVGTDRRLHPLGPHLLVGRSAAQLQLDSNHNNNNQLWFPTLQVRYQTNALLNCESGRTGTSTRRIGTPSTFTASERPQ